jgi:serine phosphatase RsbU (regulator of sigma subunit)
LSVLYVLVSIPFIYVYQLVFSYIIERIEKLKAQRIAEKHQILMDSIIYAGVVQRGLLPKASLFTQAYADHAIKWDPRDMVGGDIYWIKNFEKGSFLAVCDCTGHGVPGALLTALVVSSLDEIVNEENCHDTAEVLYQLDQKLARIFETEERAEGEKKTAHIKNGCDLAVLFTSSHGDVTISAGNTNVFICDGTEVHRVKGQRIYIGEGKITHSAKIKAHTVPANTSNKFYIASDGLYDQIGGTHSHSFGYTLFKNLILQHHNQTQEQIIAKVWEAYEAYRGNHIRLDDFVLAGFTTK